MKKACNYLQAIILLRMTLLKMLFVYLGKLRVMNKMMITEGYKIQNVNDVKQALADIAKSHPEINWERSARRNVLNMYIKDPKHKQHLVFFCTKGEHWFIKFLSDEEVINRIPM